MIFEKSFHKKSSLEICKEVGVCVCVFVCLCDMFFFATGVNFHQSGIEVRCAKSANFHASSGVRFAVVLIRFFLRGSMLPHLEGASWKILDVERCTMRFVGSSFSFGS